MNRATWWGVVAWLGVVLAGASLTWVVIGQVGADVAGDVNADALATVGTVGAAPTTGAAPTRKPTRSTPPPRRTRTPSGTTSPGSGSPSSTPTGAATPSRSATGSSPKPAATTVQRTWSGSAGTVTAACTGSRIQLLGASPADGWSVQTESSSDEVEVQFEKGEREVKVRARCSGGNPVFSVESD